LAFIFPLSFQIISHKHSLSETAIKCIAGFQKEKSSPKQIISSAGKNKPDHIIHVARILNGTWLMGSSVQSTDEELLTNIKIEGQPNA